MGVGNIVIASLLVCIVFENIFDNDNDGWIDSDDVDCVVLGSEDLSTAFASACNDNADNDNDGFVDAQDPECTTFQQNSETI